MWNSWIKSTNICRAHNGEGSHGERGSRRLTGARLQKTLPMSCPGPDPEALESWQKDFEQGSVGCNQSWRMDSVGGYCINSGGMMKPKLDQWQWSLRRGDSREI